jgi:hypothetical protein
VSDISRGQVGCQVGQPSIEDFPVGEGDESIINRACDFIAIHLALHVTIRI